MTAAYYVYALVDPLDGSPFYIGKGKGRRIGDHLREHQKFHRWSNQAKHRKIAEILARGDKVQAMVLWDGLTEGAALDIEAKAIAASRSSLTNGTNFIPPAIPIHVMAKRQLASFPPFEAWSKTANGQKPRATEVYRLLHATLERMAYGTPIPADLYA